MADDEYSARDVNNVVKLFGLFWGHPGVGLLFSNAKHLGGRYTLIPKAVFEKAVGVAELDNH